MDRKNWSAAEAKANFSRLLREAQSQPQIIENRGSEVAVVVGMEEYLALRDAQSQSLPAARMAEFLRYSEELRGSGGPELLPQLRHDRDVPELEA